jgi:ferredoxin-NADP reductase
MLYHSAKIIHKYMASPTVAVLQLHVPATLTIFSPGQWIDMVVEPYDWIGGFSIASTPRELPTMTIAVKRSNHPPAKWVHDTSKLNDLVQVSVGGTCILDNIIVPTTTTTTTTPAPTTTATAAATTTVFFAGGIGVSPILSQYCEFLYQRKMLIKYHHHHHHHHHHQKQQQQQTTTDDTHQQYHYDDKYSNNDDGVNDHNCMVEKDYPSIFVYSVSTPQELVFGKELIELSKPGCKAGIDTIIFTITQQQQQQQQQLLHENDGESRSSDTTSAGWRLDGSHDDEHVDYRTGRICLTEFITKKNITADTTTTPILDNNNNNNNNNNNDNSIFYICGPPSMIDTTVEQLERNGVPTERIKYEKWW